jgi:triosephosphate isomerase (TIM)
MSRPSLVAANWKMNGNHADNARWLQEFCAAPAACETVVCAPYVYLAQVVEGLKASRAQVGAQDVSERTAGAWTGEVSAEMLLDLGVRWAVIGHSERRASFGETDRIVADKVARAAAAGLRPIACVGESLEQHERGQTFEVVGRQVAAILERCTMAQINTGAIAYEPVWAIGTGHTATPDQAQEVHAAIRAQLARADAQAAARTRILYGGSVKPANARELFSQPDIDGGLIGGASLQAADFLKICASVAH